MTNPNFSNPTKGNLTYQDPNELIGQNAERIALDASGSQQNMSPEDYRQALERVTLNAGRDSTKATIKGTYTEGVDGEKYKAVNFTDGFIFDGQLRGSFDYAHRDPRKDASQWLVNAMEGGTVGGTLTDVIIETDQGEMVLIRKTSGDVQSAQKQTFDLISLNMANATVDRGEHIRPRPIDTNMLAGVIVIPGLPMRLRVDPKTGKEPHTKGNVTKVTGLALNEAGKMPTGHKGLKDPENHLDARERFNSKMAAIKQRGVQKYAGSAATRTVVRKPSTL